MGASVTVYWPGMTERQWEAQPGFYNDDRAWGNRDTPSWKINVVSRPPSVRNSSLPNCGRRLRYLLILVPSILFRGPRHRRSYW